MKNKSLLDSISVKTPCHENWEDMTGNAEVRFCSHCAKDVHNLSEMTERKIRKLAAKSNGKLCVRYIKRPDGKIQTVDRKFHQINQTAKIAAGVLGATLSISSINYGQQGASNVTEILKPIHQIQTDKDKVNVTNASISGKVFDPSGAMIPDAKITLHNTKSQEIRITTSNNDGFYEFKNIEPSNYQIEAEAPGFEKLTVKDVEVRADQESQKVTDLVMEVGAIVGDIVIITDYPIAMIQAASIGDKTQMEKLISTGKNVNEKDLSNKGITAIYLASENGNLEIVQMLIKAKANVNISDDDGITPLMNAIEYNQPKIASALLEAGANPNLKTKDGKTVFDFAQNEVLKNLLNQYKTAHQ